MMLTYNLHLMLQLIIICYWIFTCYKIIKRKKYIETPIFYGLLFSALVILSVLCMELTFNKGDLTFNNWGWYTTNILLSYTFNVILEYFKNHRKNLKAIEKTIETCNSNIKQNDL